MPKFDVKTSDGRVIRVNAPSNATEADAINYVNSLLNPPEAAPTELPTIPEYAGFWNSLTGSATTLPRYGLEALAYEADPTNIEKRKALLEAGAEDANQVTPGFGEGRNWEALKAMAGSSLGQWVAPAIAATGTAMTGFGAPAAPAVGAATRFAQYNVQNVLRTAQEQEAAEKEGRVSPEFDLSKTLLASAGEAALDEFQLEKFSKIFRALPFAKNMMRPGSEAPSLLVQAARAGNGSFKGNVFKGAVKGVSFEVPQEMAQSALERWQAGLSLNDDSAAEEYKQAAIGAFILGGAAGSIEGALPERPAPAKPPAPKAPPTAPVITAPPSPTVTAEEAGPTTPGMPPPAGGLPASVQAGLDLSNQLNVDEQERQKQAEEQRRQEEARRTPPPVPVSQTGGPVTGWGAFHHLASAAEREGVDLPALSRPDYVEYAIKHGVMLDDQQLRENPQHRAAKSPQELLDLRKKGYEEGSPYKQQSDEFAQTMGNIPTKYGPKTVEGYHDGVRALASNKKSNTWFHFYINGSKGTGKDGITNKGYLGFTNAAASLTGPRFKGYLESLADAGYKGQVKVIQNTVGQHSTSDQVMFHGDTEQDVQLAHQVANNYFGDEINFRDTGTDIKGKSYSQWLAEENRRRALPIFQQRLIQQKQGVPSGQGISGQQQVQGVPSGQPDVVGSGAGYEVPAQQGTAAPKGPKTQQFEDEGLDGDQRDIGKPPTGARFSRATLTPEERAADEKAVSDAYDAANGNITRAELRRATGIDNDARLDAARNRLKKKGRPIKLTIPRMTPEERQQRRQERIEEEQRRKDEERIRSEAGGETVFDERAETEEAKPEVRKPKTGGMFANDVQDIIDRIVKGWKNLPKIHVVQSISDLPGELKNIYPDSKGFIIGDEIFIIADNIGSKSGVRATLFHEALGHFGLRARFGKQLNALLLDMYAKHRGLRSAVDSWLAKNSETYSSFSKEERIIAAMEELFAEHAETEHKNIWIAQAIQRVAALIRSFLRDMGLVKNYSYSDIMDIVRQSHEAVVEGRGIGEGKVSDSIRFQRGTNVLPMSYFGKKLGPKKGGSNPGGLYETADGEKWLIKGNNAYNYGQVNQTQSNDRAKNEVLASKLYAEAGLPVPEMQLVNLNGEYDSAPNGLGVANRWMEGFKPFNPSSHKLAARRFYAVSAWLGNYDVLGMGYDNMMVDGLGTIYHIDPGGALLFRAQGLPKDDSHGVGADGMLDPTAPEWESMRKTTNEQKNVFGGMTDSDIENSVNYLNDVTPDRIKDIVSVFGQGDADFKKRLADNLIARRAAILRKAGVKDKYAKATAKKTTKVHPQQNEDLHPQQDDNGNSVIIDNTSTTLLDDLDDPNGWATWAAQDATNPKINDYKEVDLNGIKLANNIIDDPGAFFHNLDDIDEAKYLNKNLGEPEFKPKAGLKNSAGVIIVEPDGRIWTVQPTNQFGGYNVTFPKGTVEGDTTNLDMQKAALREAYEETGLLVKITGFLGDYDRSTSRTRYYIAERVGGKPFNMGWESQAVTLAPPSSMGPVLNNAVDKTILNNYIATTVNFGPSTTTTPATSAAPATDPLALDEDEQDYLDRWKKTKEYAHNKIFFSDEAWKNIERKVAKVMNIIHLKTVGFSTGENRFTSATLDSICAFVLHAESNPADINFIISGIPIQYKYDAAKFLNEINEQVVPVTTPANAVNGDYVYDASGVPSDPRNPWSRGDTAIIMRRLTTPYDSAEAERLIRERVAQLDQTNTESFKIFNGGNKIETSNHEPLLLFRGTGYELTVYDGSDKYTAPIKVIFASEKASTASGFTGDGPHDGRIYGIWMRLENPFDYRVKRHQEALIKYLNDNNLWGELDSSRGATNEREARSNINRGSWLFLEQPTIIRWIANHHDGVIMYESGITYAAIGDPTRRDEEGFRARDQIKSATGNDGNFGLYTGDIRYQRTQQNGSVTEIGATVNTFPLATNNLMEAIKNALSKVPDALRRAYLGFLSLPQIAEMFGKAGQIPSLHNLVRLLEERAATMMERSRPINANIRKWYLIANRYKADLPRFYDIAMRTTINQIDVLDPAMANDPLTREFNTLPAELQQVYRELRSEYQKYSDELLKRITDNLPANQVNALRAEYESRRLKVYLPLFRQGDYWLTYQDQNNDTVTRAFDSPRERQMAIDALNDMGGVRDIQVYSRLNQIPFKQQPPNGFAGDVIRRLKANGASDEMIDSVYATLLDYLPADSVRQMFRNNPDRGVLGFEPDVFQAYANVAKRMANQLNNMQYAMPVEEVLSNIRAEAGGNRATQAMKDVYQNIQSQVDFIRNPMNGSLVNNLSHFSYFWNIAGNISSAVVNVTQLPIVVYPLLGGKYGFGKASSALKRASQMYFNGGRDDSTDFLQDYTFYRDDLDEEYKQLFDFAVSRSAIRRPTGYEVTEARRTRVEDYTGLRAKVNQGLGFMFQNTERFNREVTLLAAYDLAKQSGMTNEQAREEALRLINEAHGTALAETGPRFFQTGLGKVAFTFKRFAQSQLYLLAKLFHQTFKGEDELVRKTAMKQVLGIYGAAYAFAGVQGMPLYGAASLLSNLIMAMFGDDDEPFDPDEAVRSAIGDLGYKGPVNQLLNIDIASRTGFNNLIWRDDPRRLADVGPALYAMESMFGPAYSTGRNILQGAKSIGEGDYERGLEYMTPSFIRNGMKGMRYGIEGARNKDGIPITEDVNGYNTFMQILGFTPADLAEARARAGSMKAAERAIIDRRTALLDRIYAARKEGDIDGLIEAMDAANEFSRKHPERGYAITSDTINRSYAAKQQKELSAVDGVYLDKNLAPYLVEEYGD